MLDDVWNQQQVRHRLRELADADPQLRRFGARQHRYQLGRTVSAEDLTRFEQDNGVTLPDAYREFITTVGDGGAGPRYPRCPPMAPTGSLRSRSMD